MKNLVEVNGIDIEKKILEKLITKIGIIIILNVFVRPYLILPLLSKHEQNQHIYRRQVQLFFKRNFYCLFVIQKLFGKAYQNRSKYNYLRIQNSFLSYKMIRHYLRLYVKKMIHFSQYLVNNHRQIVNWIFMPVLGYKTVPTINFEHDAGRLRETSEWWSWLFGQFFFRKLILEKDGASVLLLISGSNFQSFWALHFFFEN